MYILHVFFQLAAHPDLGTKGRLIMELMYKSTRSNETATASQAILKGLASDGGLLRSGKWQEKCH